MDMDGGKQDIVRLGTRQTTLNDFCQLLHIPQDYSEIDSMQAFLYAPIMEVSSNHLQSRVPRS